MPPLYLYTTLNLVDNIQKDGMITLVWENVLLGELVHKHLVCTLKKAGHGTKLRFSSLFPFNPFGLQNGALGTSSSGLFQDTSSQMISPITVWYVCNGGLGCSIYQRFQILIGGLQSVSVLVEPSSGLSKAPF